jgi:hypothetical protein
MKAVGMNVCGNMSVLRGVENVLAKRDIRRMIA